MMQQEIVALKSGGGAGGNQGGIAYHGAHSNVVTCVDAVTLRKDMDDTKKEMERWVDEMLAAQSQS